MVVFMNYVRDPQSQLASAFCGRVIDEQVVAGASQVSPMIRQNENWAMSLDDSVIERLTDEQKLRVGLKTWFGYGNIGASAKTFTVETHDGDFQARLHIHDTDEWLGRHQRGVGRLD